MEGFGRVSGFVKFRDKEESSGKESLTRDGSHDYAGDYRGSCNVGPI